MSKTYQTKLLTPPANLPLRTNEVKETLNIDVTDSTHDKEIDRLIRAATEVIQLATGRQIIEAGFILVRRAFPGPGCPIYLPFGGIQDSPAVKIEYYDADNSKIELDAADFTVSQFMEPAEIEHVQGKPWPTTFRRSEAVQVTFTCGMSKDAATLNNGMRQALLLQTKQLWGYEGESPHALKADQEKLSRLINSQTLQDDFISYG